MPGSVSFYWALTESSDEKRQIYTGGCIKTTLETSEEDVDKTTLETSEEDVDKTTLETSEAITCSFF